MNPLSALKYSSVVAAAISKNPVEARRVIGRMLEDRSQFVRVFGADLTHELERFCSMR